MFTVNFHPFFSSLQSNSFAFSEKGLFVRPLNYWSHEKRKQVLVYILQKSILSPTKLRMKLMGSHNNKKREGSNNNSSRTSPVRLEVSDGTEFSKNSLLASNSDSYDDDNGFVSRLPYLCLSQNCHLLCFWLKSLFFALFLAKVSVFALFLAKDFLFFLCYFFISLLHFSIKAF